ncbi:hypothetical protein N7530_000114 [Penicillium desertorum]|uniref:Uncharacterized protein n=1 Tax=Penicillium desertorum TaxID=1303715 RepID=A0A9W9X7J1_9EURO|nr:hypothetical protein N7530_000114 [Penicillium desertorum]
MTKGGSQAQAKPKPSPAQAQNSVWASAYRKSPEVGCGSDPLSPVPLFPNGLKIAEETVVFFGQKCSQELKGFEHEDLATTTGINEQGFFLGIDIVLDVY